MVARALEGILEDLALFASLVHSHILAACIGTGASIRLHIGPPTGCGERSGWQSLEA